VQHGYIRVIVTTNFDRLLESALREIGVEPTIVASVDALLDAGNVAWVPYGRLAWHSQNQKKLLGEMRSELVKAALTKAGFARRDPAFVGLFISNFERVIGKLSW